MPSAAATGRYYLARSQRWLAQAGFAVAILERVRWVCLQGQWRPVRRIDQLGGDLLAMRGDITVVVQVKGGESWRSGLAAARAAFTKYPLGPGSQQWIIGWPPRAREPEIEVCAVGPKAAGGPVRVPPRRKRKVLPLFAAVGR